MNDKESNYNLYMSWNSDMGYGKSSWNYEYGYGDDDTKKPKQRHEWVSVKLIISTVYNCSKCGACKEKVKDEYCQE